MRNSSTRQYGLSLLEVLVAIAILAGIAMAMGPALSSASRAAARIHERASLEEDARALQRFFENAVSQNLLFDGRDEQSILTGGPNELSFVTIDPALGTPLRLTLHVSSGTASMALYGIPAQARQDAEPVVLTTALNTAQFKYFDGDELTWRSDWRKETAPALIRFKGVLEARSGDARPFQFEAAPQGRSPLSCRFDPVSRRCR